MVNVVASVARLVLFGATIGYDLQVFFGLARIRLVACFACPIISECSKLLYIAYV